MVLMSNQNISFISNTVQRGEVPALNVIFFFLFFQAVTFTKF